ncbi:cysteine--tRNA ligase [Opitutales bacterium]|nr:cysteine--tRNA ligase [Opitutales bacterium]
MPFQLYDTFTREVREMYAMDGDTVRFYCCGPTVYGPAHVGNFRTFVLQDVFRRVLETNGLKTYHVRNLTDVDDKTIRESQAEGLSLGEFTNRWAQRFQKDCELLNLMIPHAEPSAVDHIPEQISLIERLIEAGNAYQASDGSVYFKVDAFAKYGRLSRLAEREITTNEISRETSDEYERDSAADFALWKARQQDDGENYWESPWGQGRPGWHIECSAMSMKYLGESFDLHSGGVDLIFPHHENEIAQSESVTGKTFARHWFHIAHLMVEGTKMSKSLGNLYTLDDIIDRGYGIQEVRYLLLSGSYRQPLNFTFDSLKAAQKAIKKLADFAKKIDSSASPLGSSLATEFGPFLPVQQAILKDMNTSDALGKLFGLVREISEALSKGNYANGAGEINRLRTGFRSVLDLFGLRFSEEKEEAVPAEVKKWAEQRWQAKQSKDWTAADQFREKIQQAGWVVKDSKDSFELIKA